jgi:hypothetical protein
MEVTLSGEWLYQSAGSLCQLLPQSTGSFSSGRSHGLPGSIRAAAPQDSGYVIPEAPSGLFLSLAYGSIQSRGRSLLRFVVPSEQCPPPPNRSLSPTAQMVQLLPLSYVNGMNLSVEDLWLTETCVT